MVRLFEIADICAKAKEGRLFVHNLSEAPPPKSKSKDPKRKEDDTLATSPTRSTIAGTAPSMTRADDAATASSTSMTPTILMIVGLPGSSMKKTESPSAAGVAGATAEAAPKAITATTIGTRVAGMTTCRVRIQRLYRCLC
jgi:hypothetical protein